MVVTLPETAEEVQEATEAVIFAMRVCHEQSSWSKHFAHVWPRHQEWWTWKDRESWISTSANVGSPRKGTSENDHELDAECKQNGQEMPEPKTTSRSENQHKNRRSRQVDKKG